MCSSDLKRAAEIAPNERDIRRNLALQLTLLGRHAEAAEQYKQWLRLEPRAAAQAYVDYLQRAPDAEDRPVIVQRLRGLRDTLKNEETHDASSAR